MKPLRYSLRTLFVVTSCVATLLVSVLWLTKDYRERRQAESRLRSFGAVYAHVDEDRRASAVFAQPITAADFAKLKSIDRVELQGFAVDRTTLERLRELERIDSLMFQSCRLADIEGLRLLGEVPNLKWLHFWSTPVSEEAVDALTSLQGLEGVSFNNAKITPAGLAKLQERRPNLKVDSRP